MEASDLGPPLVGDRLAVLWVDQRGKPTACSSAFTQLFGDPERLKPRDARGEALPRAQWPQARARRGDSFCSALKLELADGTRKLFNVSGYQLFGCGEKSAAGSVLIFEEAGRMDEPGHVAALVSHELRTPLTVLLAALQLMERSLAGGDGGAARRYLAEALAETRHLNVLTGELVEAARLSNGELQLRRQELGLAALVRDVCVRAQELTRGQRLQLTDVDEGIRVSADPIRLEQMLMHLLANAIIYAPGTSHIDVSVRREGAEAAVEVRDFGSGLRGQRLSRVGDPFYQAPRKDRPSRGGLGLGLFVCRELAQLHGGRLAVSSDGGPGSTFTLWLPALPAEDSGRPTVREDVAAVRHSVR